jgi:hypothetical protein
MSERRCARPLPFSREDGVMAEPLCNDYKLGRVFATRFATRTREVVLTMKDGKHKGSFIDYPMLIDLARSQCIKFVEARGLDTRRGIRFRQGDSEWIAVDSELPVSEKIRTLGYLMENRPAGVAAKAGIRGDFSRNGSMTPVLTVCC